MFRPWGFQSGHQIEWAKLLATLYNDLIKTGVQRHEVQWMIETAKSLFCRAYEISWDKTRKNPKTLYLHSFFDQIIR